MIGGEDRGTLRGNLLQVTKLDVIPAWQATRAE